MRSNEDTPAERKNLFRSIEESSAGGWAWFLLLSGWILARNLLEGVLEQPHALGFDWRGEISFAMYFLHFPLFYLGLFAALVLGLHLLSRRPIGCVARVVASGYGLLLVAPLVDAVVSSGRGYDLRYLLDAGSVLGRFWDPGAGLTEVSPGQRVEIALACVLGGAYVFTARRRPTTAAPTARGVTAAGGRLPVADLLGALLAAAGIFLTAALFGAWPALFAQLAPAGSGEGPAAYARVYQAAGLIPSESRRHALVMALPLLVLLPLLLWRAAPRRFCGTLRKLGWTRLLHYTMLAPAGAFVGFLVYREYLPGAFTNPTDWAALVVLWAAMAAAYVAARSWNDIADREGDLLNEPDRPVASGLLSVELARTVALGAALLSLGLSLCAGYHAFLLMCACVFLSWAYSSSPLRLKRWPLLATLTLALLSVLSLAIGFSLFGQEMVLQVLPSRLVLLLLIGITLGFAAKDLKDLPGDRATGVITVATLLGARGARILAAGLVAVGYVLAPLLLPLGAGFAIFALCCAGASAIVTLRRRRPDGLLLAGFLVFELVLMFCLARSPALLREQVPAELRELHAHTLAMEEEARLARPARSADPAALAPALRTAQRHGPMWHERLRWLRARVSTGEEAVGSLEALCAARPLHAAYWDALMGALSGAGQLPGAAAACTRALGLGLRPGDFLRNRAAIALAASEAAQLPGVAAPARETNEPAQAGMARDLCGALLFGQERSIAWVLAGDLLRRTGAAEAALAAYRRALRLAPALADAWAGLGEALHGLQRLPEAVAALNSAHALRPADPWILNNLGVALRDSGRLEEARARFLDAHHLAPDLFEPRFNLGLTHERLGQKADALHWYRRAEELCPGFAPLEERRRRLAGE